VGLACLAIDTTFFSAATALLSLDLGFFARLVLDNLLWVAIFLAISNALFKGKDLLRNFVIFSAYVWAFRAFCSVFGLQGFAIEPIIFFVALCLLQFFILDPKVFGRHTNTADVLGFYGLFFCLNFFVR